MEWVKLSTRYYLDPAVCVLDSDAELMFVRGLAYCGNAETGGFIPDAVVHHLTRRNPKRSADALVGAGLWTRMPTGYGIPNWQKYQVDMAEQRRQWRDRQRRARARSPATE